MDSFQASRALNRLQNVVKNNNKYRLYKLDEQYTKALQPNLVAGKLNEALGVNIGNGLNSIDLRGGKLKVNTEIDPNATSEEQLATWYNAQTPGDFDGEHKDIYDQFKPRINEFLTKNYGNKAGFTTIAGRPVFYDGSGKDITKEVTKKMMAPLVINYARENYGKTSKPSVEYMRRLGLNETDYANRILNSFLGYGVYEQQFGDINYSPMSTDKENDENDKKSIGVEGLVYDTKTIGNQSDFDEISRIGQLMPSKTSKSFVDPKDTPANKKFMQEARKEEGKPYTFNDISNPAMKEAYIAKYNQLIKEGRIKTNYQDPNNSSTAALVLQELKKSGPIVLSSKVVKSDVKLNLLGFPGELNTTDINQRSANIQRDVEHGTRFIIDPETKKEIKWNDFQRKYPNAKIEYYGYSSPHNWDNNQWGNSQQNVSANHVTVTYGSGDDKKTIPTMVSRTNQELKSKDGIASKDLNKTYKKMTVSPNTFVPAEFTIPSLKDVEIKYNNSEQVLNEFGQPIIEMIINGKQAPPLTEDQYLQVIYEEYNKK